MPTVNPRNVKLSQTAALGSKSRNVTANGVATRFKRDPATNQPTQEIEGYAVNVLSARGEVQTVKLPKTTEDQIEQIKTALSEDKVVQVTLDGFVGKFYAMLDRQTGRLIQGISATATDIKIVSVEDLVEDFDDEVIM
ncbi:hypothetical protein [Butyrivibrio sp. AE3006]|uniref:hypothetical protein n=1 Tax=Butyrivibrio sp. AE3006 TaxID=1280673 RepID=UPI000402BE28|nr:hypothetical protein [Butyrivibrio sp. AE3006]